VRIVKNGFYSLGEAEIYQGEKTGGWRVERLGMEYEILWEFSKGQAS